MSSAQDKRDPSGETVGGVFLDMDALGRLKQGTDRSQVAAAWLQTLSRQNPAMRQGLVLLSSAGQGRFEPASVWPAGATPERTLLASLETAVRNARVIIQTLQEAEGDGVALAVPILIGGKLRGATGVVLEPADQPGIQLMLDQLQWGAGWLETLVQRARLDDSAGLVTVVELLATSLHHARFQEAALATATELAAALDCERVAVSFLRGRHNRVRALSNSASIGRNAALIRGIEAAMDEALDQEATVVWPPPEGGTERVTRAHETLARAHDMSAICTVPLSEGDRPIGALLLERADGRSFDRDTVRLCEHAGALLGPTLDTKRREDRWLPAKTWDAGGNLMRALFGPRNAALKLGVLLAVAFAAFCVFAKGTYRVTADAVLEGSVQRSISAPMTGYLADAYVRAGDEVREGQLLANLDMTDLRLEKLRSLAERAKQERELSEARARKERARMQILAAQIGQADAQIALIDAQMERMRMTAPFDGIVVAGDLSQALGAPVERGEVLFQIAPLDDFRVMLKVSERDIGDVAAGQTGSLALSAMPSEPLPIAVQRITPISAAEEGRNVFSVDSRLTDTGGALLRPGMEGVAKVEIGERRLVWNWTRNLVLWTRMFLWSWMP